MDETRWKIFSGLVVSILVFCTTWGAGAALAQEGTPLSAESACADCISFTEHVRIGDGVGENYAMGSPFMLKDSLGRYWVGQPGEIRRFSPEGDLIDVIGRPGNGPLEFELAAPFFVNPDGTVQVRDLSQPRVTVIDSAGRLVETRPLPIGIFRDLLATNPAGREYFGHGEVFGAEKLGFPLHTVDSLGEVNSFGRAPEGVVTSPFYEQRWLAADADNLYSVRFYEYEIEVWTRDGELTNRFFGPALNDAPVEAGPLSGDNPPPNRIMDLYSMGDGRLFVLSWRRRDGWQSDTSEVLLPNGVPTLTGSPLDIFESQIDIVDLATRRVVSTQRIEAILYGFLSPTEVFGLRPTESGIPQPTVWKVTIR